MSPSVCTVCTRVKPCAARLCRTPLVVTLRHSRSAIVRFPLDTREAVEHERRPRHMRLGSMIIRFR